MAAKDSDLFDEVQDEVISKIMKPFLSYRDLENSLKKTCTEEENPIMKVYENGIHAYLNTNPSKTYNGNISTYMGNISRGGSIDYICPENVDTCNNSHSDDQLNVMHRPESTVNEAVIPTDIPSPLLLRAGSKVDHTSQLQKKNGRISKTYYYGLSLDHDKNVKLVIEKGRNILRSEKLNLIDGKCEYDGCKFAVEHPEGKPCCKVTVDHKIEVGANIEKVVGLHFKVQGKDKEGQHNKGQVEKEVFEVLKFDKKKAILSEICYRGQAGASKEIDVDVEKRKKKEKNMIYILFGDFIFPIDTYDFYVYSVVGIKLNPSIKDYDEHWPWRDESNKSVAPPTKTTYKELCESITSPDQFFNILYAVLEGDFSSISNKHGVDTDSYTQQIQLCIALGICESIRNFQSIKMTQALLDIRFCSLSGEELKKLIHIHPMVTKGSFKNRQTGYSRPIPAVQEKVGPFFKKLGEIEQR